MISNATGPFFRDALVGIEDIAHLYTGAEGPSLVAHRRAAERYLDDKSLGDLGRQRFENELDQCRRQVAALMKGDVASVALLGNASDAISRLVDSLQLPPGSNVVTSDLEFPSGVHSLQVQRARGVEVRIVRSRDGDLDGADFDRAIDGNTRLVLSSHVSYVSGVRIHPAELREAAHSVGAAFILDATQSLGVIPVDASDADAIVSSTYKWLLGPHGVGVLQMSKPDLFQAHIDAVGWRSVDDVFADDRFERYRLRNGARRYELGFPCFAAIYMLNESLSLLRSVDPAALETHVAELTSRLADALSERGARLLTPAEPARRAGNVSVVSHDGAGVAARLLELGVHAWGGDGRVRFSVHGFTTAAEVDTAIRAFGETS